MLKIILVMLAGMGLGFALRKAGLLKHIGKSISVTIKIMLFLLGLEVGGNPEIIGNLSTLGLQALLISFAGTLGSLLAGWGLYLWIFKKDKELNRPDDTATPESKASVKSDCLIVVLMFIAGAITGVTGLVDPGFIGDKTVLIVLYLLMFQVGISLGHDTSLKSAVKGIRPTVLLVPLATIVGTLSFRPSPGFSSPNGPYRMYWRQAADSHTIRCLPS